MAGWARSMWYGINIGLAGRLRHADAAVPLAEFARGLEVHYHSLGGTLARRVVGDAGQQRAAFKAAGASGALDLMTWLDAEQVNLPRRLDRYPTPALNRELYFWLAAFLAEDHALPGEEAWPLGVRHLLRGAATSARVAAKYPALAERYRRLCAAELAQRTRALPNWDTPSAHPARLLETTIRHALGGERPTRDAWLTQALDAVRRGAPVPGACPVGGDTFLPFLPVPLWGNPLGALSGLRFFLFKRQLRRRAHGERRALVRPRFEPQHRPRVAPGAPARGRFVYPEWNYDRHVYRRDWCAVTEKDPPLGTRGVASDAAVALLAQRVRRQFEALRQLSGWNRRRDSGEELDLDAYVDSMSDARGCGRCDTRFYQQRTRRWRDLSVAVLMDASRSTEAWVGTHRVIEIERAAMLTLAAALTAVGDDFALYAFASESRQRVVCYRIKHFDEAYGERARRRLLGLTPAYYTRMGAAIRHVGARLEQRTSSQKLLLVLTDGRPNDPPDGYEGRYALEDTRRALLELRARGIHGFGLTIDQRGREYLPHLFGPGRYAVLSQPQFLPRVLPKLYARLTLAP